MDAPLVIEDGNVYCVKYLIHFETIVVFTVTDRQTDLPYLPGAWRQIVSIICKTVL